MKKLLVWLCLCGAMFCPATYAFDGFVWPVMTDQVTMPSINSVDPTTVPRENCGWSYNGNIFGAFCPDCSGHSTHPYHPGIDLNRQDGNDVDEPVYSIGDGTVIRVTDLPGLGRAVIILYELPFTVDFQNYALDGTVLRNNDRYSNQLSVMYLHLNETSVSLDQGDAISRGQYVGRIKDGAGEERRFFKGVDIISGNLEGAVTTNGEHYPPEITNDFAFAPDTVNQLHPYNFNFFNIANNHLTDQGARGYQETSDNLKRLGFNFSGCPDGQVGECSYKIFPVGDVNIGMIGFSMIYEQPTISSIVEMIQKVSAKNDIVIVNVHWGNEYQVKFSQKQQDIAHAIIDAGADAVVGHHPHVVQEVEIYKQKPIFYSLGNFIFDQYFSQETQQGLSVGLTFKGKPGEKFDFEASIFPFEAIAGKIKLMTDEAKEKLLKSHSINTRYVQ